METLDKVKRRIDTTEDIQSVVRTMKALAAVNIRQYERAVESLSDYRRTVDMGMQVLLRSASESARRGTGAATSRTGVIVFGSDQGMCGPLNDRVVDHALEMLDRLHVDKEDRLVLPVGGRVSSRLAEPEQQLEEEIRLPASIPAIARQVQEVLFVVDDWQSRGKLDRLILVYAQHESRSSYRAHAEQLLPLDERWIAKLKRKEWKSNRLPMISMEPEPLFSSLLRQHLFIGIYRAFAESLASENASRLASMRRAEKNISDRLDELKTDYHQQRQMAVTSELLDIVGAFETLGDVEG